MKTAFERYGGQIITILIVLFGWIFIAGGDRRTALDTAQTALNRAEALERELKTNYVQKEMLIRIEAMINQRMDGLDRKSDETREELRRIRTALETRR